MKKEIGCLYYYGNNFRFPIWKSCFSFFFFFHKIKFPGSPGDIVDNIRIIFIIVTWTSSLMSTKKFFHFDFWQLDFFPMWHLFYHHYFSSSSTSTQNINTDNRSNWFDLKMKMFLLLFFKWILFVIVVVNAKDYSDHHHHSNFYTLTSSILSSSRHHVFNKTREKRNVQIFMWWSNFWNLNFKFFVFRKFRTQNNKQHNFHIFHPEKSSFLSSLKLIFVRSVFFPLNHSLHRSINQISFDFWLC